jgi:hypothetical protein
MNLFFLVACLHACLLPRSHPSHEPNQTKTSHHHHHPPPIIHSCHSHQPLSTTPAPPPTCSILTHYYDTCTYTAAAARPSRSRSLANQTKVNKIDRWASSPETFSAHRDKEKKEKKTSEEKEKEEAARQPSNQNQTKKMIKKNKKKKKSGI